MYSYTSISNGRHGVFSPRSPLVEQDIPLLLRHPLPPPPRFCALPAASPPPTPAVLWFSNCACGPGRKENPPHLLWNRMVLPFAMHTHTHHVFVNVWRFYLPTPHLWNRMIFLFALRHRQRHRDTETHTHTPRVCVCMAFSLRTCSPAKPPFHSFPPSPPGILSCTLGTLVLQ